MPKDLFSGHAKAYATFRPIYPHVLYDFIFQHAQSFNSAWDCGTGNGQVASALATRFTSVQASDISSKQLENAHLGDNIHYQISSAEQTNFTDQAFDLITVGQALHWFDIEKFYAEVNRVAKRKGVLAVFGYSPVQFTPIFNEVLDDFYYNVIYKHWDAERKLVEDRYKTLNFPFEEIIPPEFRINLNWTIEDLSGYMSTWSAVQKFIQQKGHNPVDEFIEKVKPLWRAERESVYFPLFLRIGRINK